MYQEPGLRLVSSPHRAEAICLLSQAHRNHVSEGVSQPHQSRVPTSGTRHSSASSPSPAPSPATLTTGPETSGAASVLVAQAPLWVKGQRLQAGALQRATWLAGPGGPCEVLYRTLAEWGLRGPPRDVLQSLCCQLKGFPERSLPESAPAPRAPPPSHCLLGTLSRGHK